MGHTVELLLFEGERSTNTFGPAFRYGKILVDHYATFKDAGTEIIERVLHVESCWKRTSMQIDFLRQVWSTLDEEHQNIQNQILRVLVSKLEAAISQIERVQRKKKNKDGDNETTVVDIKRWKYVLIKECVEKAIQELETWQKMFDPSWFLIIKVGNPLIDQELAKDDKTQVGSIRTARNLRDSFKDYPKIKTSIFLPEEGLSSATRHNILFSTAQAMQRTASTKWLIVDSITCNPEVNVSVFTKDIRDLATKLRQADTLAFGLLNCRGVVKVTDPIQKATTFHLIFNIPEGLETPRSLRDILNSPDNSISLSDRFKVARQLATSVSYIHTYGFVHKNIRPETILVFRNQKSQLGASFLLGFENFRLVEGKTMRFGDCIWEKDLYRHLHRQGLKPEKDYIMQYDIYSLGVCLLEIGLWQSFIIYNDEGSGPSPSTIVGILNDPDDDEIKKALLLKDTLVDLAKQRLPSRMGDKYSAIVVNCLTCLDESNVDFGDETEFEDADGVLVGVRYIEKVRYHDIIK